MALTVSVATTDQVKTSQTSWAFAIGATFAAGDWVVIGIAADNAGTNGEATITGVTDDAGNTYTSRVAALQDPGSFAAGVQLSVYTAPVTSALTATDNVTVAFSPATAAKAAVVWKVAPGAGQTVAFDAADGAGGSTADPSLTSSSLASGAAIFGFFGVEGTGIPSAGDSDTTNGNWSTLQSIETTGSPTASNIGVESQYKVVTASGAQTYNIAGYSSIDWCIGWVSLTAVTSAAAPFPVRNRSMRALLVR